MLSGVNMLNINLNSGTIYMECFLFIEVNVRDDCFMNHHKHIVHKLNNIVNTNCHIKHVNRVLYVYKLYHAS